MIPERGLDKYLVNKAAALAAHRDSFAGGDSVRETISAECTASDLTGVRRLRIRDFHLVSDSGPGFGGFGLGPSSPELLLGVLATCLTHTYLITAAKLGIALDRVNVRFEAENNDAGFLDLETGDPPYPFNIRAVVRVDSSEPGERLDRLHELATASCPLTKLIREPQSVSISIARE